MDLPVTEANGAQEPLFDLPPETPRPHLPLRARQMLEVYGRTPGKRCRTCVHLVGKQWAKVYYKCELTRQSNGTKTDWGRSWPACGEYEER